MIDLSGQRFGKLVVKHRAENSARGAARWVAICECGGYTTAESTDLQRGHTTSCGCARDEGSVALGDRLEALTRNPDNQFVHGSRFQAGRAPVDIGRYLGLHPSTVWLWYAGKRKVPARHLPQLAQFFDMTVDQLLDGQQVTESSNVRAAYPAYDAGGKYALDVKPRHELYCLLCARGIGKDGVLMDTDQLPQRIVPCEHCGGAMLARRVEDSGLERLMRQQVAA